MFENELLEAKEIAINTEPTVLSKFLSWKYPFGSSEGQNAVNTHIYTTKPNLQTAPVVLLSTDTLKPVD